MAAMGRWAVLLVPGVLLALCALVLVLSAMESWVRAEPSPLRAPERRPVVEAEGVRADVAGPDVAGRNVVGRDVAGCDVVGAASASA